MREASVRDFILSYGFVIVLVLVFVSFSIAAPNFLTLSNIMAILHAAAPLMITTCGLALVIMTAKLDISIGSIAYLSAGIGTMLVFEQGQPLILGFLLMALCGAVLGAINGFGVVIFKINPLIITLGMMFIARGLALQVTDSLLIGMPEPMRAFGHARIGPVFIDILVALAVLGIMHLIHTHTLFGRHVMAIGNGEEVAARLGVRVPRVVFLAFVLSGLFASLGGIITLTQVGAVTSALGRGLEFTAIAAIVVGGISLFGGEGSIIPGLILGTLTLAIIQNGLNHVGANPFAYRIVSGAIIFIAMYADSLKSLVRPQVVAIAEGES